MDLSVATPDPFPFIRERNFFQTQIRSRGHYPPFHLKPFIDFPLLWRRKRTPWQGLARSGLCPHLPHSPAAPPHSWFWAALVFFQSWHCSKCDHLGLEHSPLFALLPPAHGTVPSSSGLRIHVTFSRMTLLPVVPTGMSVDCRIRSAPLPLQFAISRWCHHS